MARAVRIEYGGAFYHVMARGNRRERIFRDEADRLLFYQTLGEACERTGWRVHAWVLMSNHYHLMVETPEANLVAGMRWLQNTYTRRHNCRHRLWGRLFGDRYKAILSEGGNMSLDSAENALDSFVSLEKSIMIKLFPYCRILLSLALGSSLVVSQAGADVTLLAHFHTRTP